MIEILEWVIYAISILIASLWMIGSFIPSLSKLWRRRSYKFKDRYNLFVLRCSAFNCMLCFFRLGLAPTEPFSYVFLAIAIAFFILDSFAIRAIL